jgi:hypothetical protein
VGRRMRSAMPSVEPVAAGKLLNMGGDIDARDPSEVIRAAVMADPRVRSVKLIGSRAAGTATQLSDWDYRITSADPGAVASQLPNLTAGLKPLAQQWDPLASAPVYMIILPGAVKADLFPGASPSTLPVSRTRTGCATSTLTSGTGTFGSAPNGCVG